MTTEIDRDTRAVGTGPVSLDVAMARKLGWSEERIALAWERMKRIALTAEPEPTDDEKWTRIEQHRARVGEDDVYPTRALRTWGEARGGKRPEAKPVVTRVIALCNGCSPLKKKHQCIGVVCVPGAAGYCECGRLGCAGRKT